MSARSDLTLYLGALFGSEPPGRFVELRVAREGGGMLQHFFGARDLERIAIEAIGMSPRSDVYIGVAPRTRKEGKRSAIERLHVLWVDVDGDRDKLRAFRPLPSIVVGSGSGVHAYWALADPVGPDEAERANRQIAQALDGDVRATDAARILRPPGTFNHKQGEPRPVEMLRCEAEVFTIADVVGQLPPEPEPGRVAGPRLARREFEDGADVLAAIAPPTYFRLLTDADVPDRGGTVRCPLPDHEDRTPSCHVYADVAAGWYCFGCGRGGSLIDLGAELWGMDPRGRGYHDLRRRLAGELTGMAVPL